MERLKKRRDYLAAAGGVKAVRNAFILQSRRRENERAGPARFGFTVTRKTARKAVDRNRIRRRLREAARLAEPAATAGHDFVVIGRRAALSTPFGDLVADLENAILEIRGMATRADDRSADHWVRDNTGDAAERGRQSGARKAARRQS